jgi:hypothetical protein
MNFYRIISSIVFTLPLIDVSTFYTKLTPKGPRVFFSKNTPNLPFLAQEAQMKFFSLFCTSTVGSCPRLLGEHVQKVLRELSAWIVRL